MLMVVFVVPVTLKLRTALGGPIQTCRYNIMQVIAINILSSYHICGKVISSLHENRILISAQGQAFS